MLGNRVSIIISIKSPKVQIALRLETIVTKSQIKDSIIGNNISCGSVPLYFSHSSLSPPVRKHTQGTEVSGPPNLSWYQHDD